jgi:3-oxoadipate CoA-transferase alpha subunit
MLKNKVCPTFLDAIADIPDGAVIGFGGFGSAGMPTNLIFALADQGARDLTLVANGTGGQPGGAVRGDAGIGMLVERGQVRKAICAFTATTHASAVLPFTAYYEAGKVEAELVPQGTIAERLRAAGAGIPAFYTPTAVGTELAEGRETRVIGAREYLLEYALHLDYAFIRANRSDTFGNLKYRGAQRNFNPVMAMAARITVAEVESIEPLGAIDPDDVHTPGLYVARVVLVPPEPHGWWPKRPGGTA